MKLARNGTFDNKDWNAVIPGNNDVWTLWHLPNVNTSYIFNKSNPNILHRPMNFVTHFKSNCYVKKGTTKVLACIPYTLGETLFITKGVAISWFQNFRHYLLSSLYKRSCDLMRLPALCSNRNTSLTSARFVLIVTLLKVSIFLNWSLLETF